MEDLIIYDKGNIKFVCVDDEITEDYCVSGFNDHHSHKELDPALDHYMTFGYAVLFD